MSKLVPLLDDGSDEELDFSINKGYAEKYDKWRKKEEMMKLKALGEELSESSSSSEDEEEPVIEKDFLKTLSLIKSRDPVIYDEKVTFFKDEGIPKKPKEKKEKSLFMKNYETELMLKTEGKSSDEDEDDLPSKPNSKELAELAKSFKTAVDSDEEDGEGGLFEVKSKTKQEEEKEEEEHLKWLKGQKKKIDKETEKELSFLRKYWNDTKLDEGEKFLKDYLLNQRFLDNNAEDIPSFEQLEDELEQEDETIAQQEQFEEKYNFRFEEPDPEFIKRYPRTIGDSLRRVDTRRKAKREEREERRKRDKEQMKEELKRLKALKRKEIEEKFFKLKEASGKDEINFDESDIESDFDPDKHDEKMKELFDDDYYAEEEEQKPQFLFDAEIDDEDWDHWTREQAKQKASDENADLEEKEEFSASEVEEPVDRKAELEQEMIESTRTGRRKAKKKSLFAKLISQPKPIYDPDGKSFQEYLDEYYKLDYEDVIGDLPVKFKYRKVIPNDFGLTTDEILAANDKELNRWCSVKKTCQYRRDDEELFEVQAFKKKAENVEVKKKILASVYAPPEEDVAVGNETNKTESNDKPKKKRSRKKKKKSLNGIDNELNVLNESKETTEDQVETEFADDVPSTEVPNDNDAEPKKKKSRKRKKKSLNAVGNDQNNLQYESVDSVDQVEAESANEIPSKEQKKKKRKHNTIDECNQDAFQNSILGDGSTHEESISEELADGLPKKKKHKKSHSSGENDMDTSISPLENIFQTPDSTKKKKHKKELSLEDTDIAIGLESSENVPNIEDMSPKKKKHQQSQLYQVQEEHGSSNLNNSTQSQESSSSKKKKHKKNANATETSHRMTDRRSSFHAQKGFRAENEQSSFHSKKSKKFKQKHFKPQSAGTQNDKRLALSDSRLAAFGINPKKFKNKIIYSQK